MKMSLLVSNKEKAQSLNTLLCLLQGCVGYETVVELRNDDAAEGHILQVDGYMNVSMVDVTFTRAKTGTVMHFEDFYIQGKNLRYVHIPDELDITQTIQAQLGIASHIREHKERQPPRKKFTDNRKETRNRLFGKIQARLKMLPKDQGGFKEEEKEPVDTPDKTE